MERDGGGCASPRGTAILTVVGTVFVTLTIIRRADSGHAVLPLDIIVGAFTLLLTTHDLPDVERLCRRVVVIDQGRVLVDDELAALWEGFAGHRVLVVELVEPVAPLLGLAGVVDVTVEAQGLRQRLEFSPGATTAAELIGAVAQQVELRDVSVVEPSIEDLVRTLYYSR